MSLCQTPLAEQDADVIAHAFERACLAASHMLSTMNDVQVYGRFRFIMRNLLTGMPVEIDELLLAESRAVMARIASRTFPGE